MSDSATQPESHDPLLGADVADVGSDEVVLPGHDQPAWLLPSLVVAFGALIAWLAIFGADASDSVATGSSTPTDAREVSGAETTGTDDLEVGAAQEAADSTVQSAPVTDPGTAPAAPGVSDADSTEVDAAIVDPIADAEAADAVSDAEGLPDADLDLPESGTIRVGGADYPLVRSCVGVQPLAPSSDADVVSAHVFSPAPGSSVDAAVEQVVERWVLADGSGGVRIDGGGADGAVAAEVIDGRDGAFVATIELADGGRVDVAVNPPADGDPRRECVDLVVTNEPGQFAFPYTRAVLAVCRDGDLEADGRVEALLTEGGRMIATGNGDGTHSLQLVAQETPLGPSLDVIDPAGALFVDGDRLGYSGLATDGNTSLDLTFDVDTAGAGSCAARTD